MFESPIKIIQGHLQMELENNILKAVQAQHVEVNKEELLKALKYDREQYEKGYEDAKKEFAEKLDRIVEQLEKVKKYNEDSYEEWKGATVSRYYEIRANTYKHAIEIVKGGNEK